jgi:hypothetical protein
MKIKSSDLKDIIAEELSSLDEGLMDMLGFSQKSKDMKQIAASLPGWKTSGPQSSSGVDIDSINDAIKTLKSHDEGNDLDLIRLIAKLTKIVSTTRVDREVGPRDTGSKRRSTDVSPDDPDHPDNIRRRRDDREYAELKKKNANAERRRRDAVAYQVGDRYSQRSGYAGLEEIVREEFAKVLKEADTESLQKELMAAVDTIVNAYEGVDLPPSVVDLKAMIEAGNLLQAHHDLKDMWNELLVYHRDAGRAGQKLPRVPSTAFNAIFRLLKKVPDSIGGQVGQRTPQRPIDRDKDGNRIPVFEVK